MKPTGKHILKFSFCTGIREWTVSTTLPTPSCTQFRHTFYHFFPRLWSACVCKSLHKQTDYSDGGRWHIGSRMFFCLPVCRLVTSIRGEWSRAHPAQSRSGAKTMERRERLSRSWRYFSCTMGWNGHSPQGNNRIITIWYFHQTPLAPYSQYVDK